MNLTRTTHAERMTMEFRRLLIGGLAAALVLSIGAEETMAAESQTRPATAPTHVLIYKPGKKWVQGKALGEQDLKHHVEYMTGLFKEKLVQAGGPFAGEDTGFYLIKVKDSDAAAKIVDNDPAVVAGTFKVTVKPWHVLMDQFSFPGPDGYGYRVLKYTPGKNWAKGKPITEQNTAEHFKYIQDQYAKRRVLLAGPLGNEDAGGYVILAKSDEEMTAFLDADPGVKSGLFRVEDSNRHAWQVIFGKAK